MANPASITITDLTANGSANQPAVQTIDTDGDVPCLADGRTDRLMFEFINTDDAATVITVKAGANPPALAARPLVINLSATGGGTDKKIVGPFESGRFLQANGSIILNFDGGASPTVTVRAYRLPKQI